MKCATQQRSIGVTIAGINKIIQGKRKVDRLKKSPWNFIVMEQKTYWTVTGRLDDWTLFGDNPYRSTF
jgi:hypothetical protein